MLSDTLFERRYEINNVLRMSVIGFYDQEVERWSTILISIRLFGIPQTLNEWGLSVMHSMTTVHGHIWACTRSRSLLGPRGAALRFYVSVALRIISQAADLNPSGAVSSYQFITSAAGVRSSSA